MIEFVQSKSREILFNCCKRYAKEKSLNVEDVQLILGLNEKGNTYTLCERYQPKEEKDFLGVLGVKIDFLLYSQIAPPFILKSLVRFASVYNVRIGDIKVMCIPSINEKGKPDIQLFVYKGNDYLDTINFQDLFREEDITMPT